MLLRDYLNEFELDWAQAPVRSELIPKAALKGAKILLIGEQAELQKAIAWSFSRGMTVIDQAYVCRARHWKMECLKRRLREQNTKCFVLKRQIT